MLSKFRYVPCIAHVARYTFALALLISVSGAAQTYTFEREWGIEGTGGEEFNRPDGVAVDDSGAVYVTDETENRVMKFDADGAYIWLWSGAYDSDGNLLTAEDGVESQFGP